MPLPTPPPVQTNLLAMPLIDMTVQTGTNEDWISAIKYLVDDGTTNPPQMDLRGITFNMEVRATIESHDVVLTASTDDGTIMIGMSPDYGYLLFNIPLKMIAQLIPGTYVGDVVGADGLAVRRVIVIDLQIVEGITR
jgi:hypothetical protein